MFEDLKDKVILITGSSRGIGFETAKILHSLGAKLILNSNKYLEDLKSASHQLNDAHYEVCDVTKDEKVKEMIHSIKNKFGRIDGLVNNAGGGGWASIMGSNKEWKDSLDLDLMASVYTCRYVIPIMQKQKKGSIVNISSIWGLPDTAKPSIASYCCAKAALIKLTQCLADEYAPDIRVNCVAPGWTRTKMTEDDWNDGGIKFMQKNTLIERIAEPVEMAQIIAFMLSESSSCLTGITIDATGGYKLAREHLP